MIAIIIALAGVLIALIAVAFSLKKKSDDQQIINNLFSDRSFLVDQNLEYSKKLQNAYKEIENLKKNKNKK